MFKWQLTNALYVVVRCDDKCIFEGDGWTTPCRSSIAPCADLSFPFYCNITDTCLAVDDLCGEDSCYTDLDWNDRYYKELGDRYKCGENCLSEDMSCHGSCEGALSVSKYYWDKLIPCGERCISEDEANGRFGYQMYVCNGKCLEMSPIIFK